jgi:predicted metal-binding protein
MTFVVKIIPVIDHSVRKLCARPYPNHKFGCPNFNKCERCPPKAKLIEDVFDFTKPIYAVYNVFDYKSHVDKMKASHPDWSDRQLRCVLYWQGGARKKLKERVFTFLRENRDTIACFTPEACGVNVTATMAAVGIHLEWPPQNVAYQITFVGTPK